MNQLFKPQNRGHRAESSLILGNRSLGSNNYASAVFHYLHTIQNVPALGKTVAGNLALARYKHVSAQRNNIRKRIAVCGWELSQIAAERVYSLADYFRPFSDVAIIGSLFANSGRELWQPQKNTAIPTHTIVVEDESQFLAQAIAFVSTHPFDLVHLCKTRAPNLILGILYKLIWDARVIVDIDNDALAFAHAENPLSINALTQKNTGFLALKNLDGVDWTHLAVGLSQAFDGITVADFALQQRFGGEIIPLEGNDIQNPAGRSDALPEQEILFKANSQRLKWLVDSLNHATSLSQEMATFVKMLSTLDNRLPSLLHSYDLRNYIQLPETGVSTYPIQIHEGYADRNDRGLLGSQGQQPSHEKASPDKLLPTIKLNPINELEIDAENSSYWMSLGEDPYFQIELNEHQPLTSGWYRIDIIIEGWCKKSVAKFYLDYGSGYSENNIFPLPYTSEQLATRVIHLGESVCNMRFDPQENKGRFRIVDFRISPVTDDDAVDLILDQLASSPEYEGKTSHQIKDEILAKTPGQSCLSPDEIIKIYNYIFLSPQSKINYCDWVNYIESNNLPRPAEIASTLAALKNNVLFSIIMPVYNTDETFLRECIDSVLAQAYPHWELCIADDASPMPHVRQVLDHYAQFDERIRIVYRSENGHISRASNSALEITQGEFVVLLDHDDVLPELALYFMALAINENPHGQIFYSDEDKLDLDGNRSYPHFKSDWNPDLFFSQNYVSHLGVYRRELLEHIQGFRAGVEGSQDQDLLLRCLPFVKPGEIIHIPRVLYHWRVSEGSTALASGEKSYTTDAGIKALQDYFTDQCMPDVKVTMGLVPNTYRVQYPVPTPEPLVSLLIPTRDMLSVLEPCIRSILDKTTYQNFEIIILDNGSIEAETLRFFESIQAEDNRIKVIVYDHPFNYSAINNFGVKHARGELIGLVNNDIEVISPEWLTEMVSHALRPEIGCVGAKLYYDDDTIQHAGVIVGLGGVAGHSHKHYLRHDVGYFHRLILVQNLSAVTAACLVIRKTIFEEVGGLEDENLKVAFNDVDFCLKVREAGYRNLWTPYAELYHHESKSRGSEDTPEKIQRFNKEIEFISNKWGASLKLDPYYNPNLTMAKEDFSL
jgi:O-antigen biosynthesis protein